MTIIKNSDLARILSFHYIDKFHNGIIHEHIWIQIYENIIQISPIYCKNCNIEFGCVLYKQQDSDDTKWHELTCNEILIKKLLE